MLPFGRNKGTGDPTDHSSFHARTPETESLLSPNDPPRGHSTISGDAGLRAQSCSEAPGPESPRSVTGQDFRGPGCRPSPTLHAEGN